MAATHPFAARYEAVLLALDVDAGGSPETEPPGHLADTVDADAARDVVEMDVAGLLDGVGQRQRTVAALLPAVEEAVAEFHLAGAEHPVIGRDRPGLQAGQRDDHLEGRSRRVLAADRAVHQRRPGMPHQRAPLSRIEAQVEGVGVEARRRDESQQLSRMYVHDHDRSGFVAETFVGQALEFGVDGQAHVASGFAALPLELADGPAIGVDLDLDVPGLASQGHLAGLLDASLARAESRQLEQRIAGLLLRRHGADVADEMGQRLAVGIETRLSNVGLHAGQVGHVRVDSCELPPGQILEDRDGHEAGVAFGLAQHPAQVVVVDPHQTAQHGQGPRHAGRLLGDHEYPIVPPVVGHLGPEAVENAASGPRQQTPRDPVLLGEHPVAAGADHLEVVEAAHEHRGERRRTPREHQRPPGERLPPDQVPLHVRPFAAPTGRRGRKSR